MLPTNIAGFRQQAMTTLSTPVFDHFEGGVEDEQTMLENRAGLGRVKLVQRILAHVDAPRLTTELLGATLRLPVVLAPTGHHDVAHPDGELATARAAAAAGTTMILSTGSSYPLEDVREASDGVLWFQLFQLSDRGIVEDLVHRAEAAGYTALVVTVDTQALGNFERNVAAGDRIAAMREGNLEKYLDGKRSLIDLFTGAVDWSFIGWLRSLTRLPIVIKGVQAAEDATACVAEGVDAVYVSNHGGRQLDSGPSTIELLPDVVDAVAGRRPILVDGGFRRGTDLIKALALGADAVVIGRPYLYGLAAHGESGVRRVLEILAQELERDLILMGCAGVAELDRSWLRLTTGFGIRSVSG